MIDDGHINARLQGRQIMQAEKDGHYLILHMNDGHKIVVGWVNDNGEPSKGEPVLIRQDARVMLPGIDFSGFAGGW